MKYKIDPRKLAKAPAHISSALFACLEFDDSSPFFKQVQQYMLPNTQEARWDELEKAVKTAYSNLGHRQESAFNTQFKRIHGRLRVMSDSLNRLTT